MVSWIYTYLQLIKWYAQTMYSFLYVNHTSTKRFLRSMWYFTLIGTTSSYGSRAGSGRGTCAFPTSPWLARPGVMRRKGAVQHIHFSMKSGWSITVIWEVSETLCDPMDCRLPGSSVHRRILQARVLEWVAISFSRGSFWPRDWTWSPALQADSLPFEPPGKPVEDTGRMITPAAQDPSLSLSSCLCLCQHMRAHTHACMHTHTRARTCTHTHMHTHTHTPESCLCVVASLQTLAWQWVWGGPCEVMGLAFPFLCLVVSISTNTKNS